MDVKQLRIQDYSYLLPEDRIAFHPLPRRDASKLLVYREGCITDDVFTNLSNYIPANATLFFNQTKVIYARLLFYKESGARIELFCLEPSPVYSDMSTAMLQKSKVLWHCMVGGASKWKSDRVLEMTLPKGNISLYARQIKKAASYYEIEFSWNDASLSFAEILHAAGKVPLPPYIRRDVEKDDADRYQTIFAAYEGSVAAPTASLHFTPQVVADLEAKGIQTKHVTLHVGAGTFKPVKSDTMEEHPMHAEWFSIRASTIHDLLLHPDRFVIPVGTTCLRTLETLYWIGLKLVKQMPIDFSGIALEQWEVYSLKPDVSRDEALGALLHYMHEHKLEELFTRTQILIAPSYTFHLCHALVTNFHQPQSTLLLLVAAFIGPQWLELYRYALDHNYRFLSYGDSSLLWLKQFY